MSRSPEERLLLLTATVVFDDARRHALEALCSGALDWDRVIERALAQGTAPLLAAHVSSLTTHSVSKAVRERLTNIARISWAHGAVLTDVWREVMRLFNARGIPSLTLKGIALGHTIYPDVGLRPMVDVDILVHPDDRERAADVLREVGFVTPGGAIDEADRSRSFMFFRRGQVVVDLRWHVATWARFTGIIHSDDETLWSRTRTLTIGDVEGMTAAPEGTLVYLALHLTLGSEFGRLIWITDLDALIRAEKDLDWDRVLHEATRWRARMILGYALAVAEAALGTPVPSAVQTALRFGRARRALLGFLVEFPRPVGLQSAINELRLYVAEPLVMDRLRDVVRVVLRSVFPPAEWVQQHYGLPARWQVALYRVLHPLRVGYLAVTRLR